MARPKKITDKQDKKQYGWLADYQWKPGQSGNPKGRPKGKTMKEWAKLFLMELPDDKKMEFLRGIAPDIVWRMAEGNPAQDLTSGGEKIIPSPILGYKKLGYKKNAISRGNGNKEDSEAQKED